MRTIGRVRVKDEWQEERSFAGRLVVGGVIASLLFIILVTRLVVLTVAEHDKYLVLSEGNRVRVVPIAPNRGLIFDRNGVLLAENTPNYQLELVPEQIANLDDTLARLAAMVELRPADLERFQESRRGQRRFTPIPLRLRLSEAEVARFSVHRYEFPGVDIQARLTRDYPYGALTGHAVGYVAAINANELKRLDPARYAATQAVGKLGVERAYEDVLHGAPGNREIETNAQGRALRELTVTAPQPGRDVYLNLDIVLQRAADEALGEFKGAVVAIDPRDGGILAFVSKPEYDPNLFVDGIDSATFTGLNTDPRRPLYNRALNGVYPPGSTIKPLIAISAIERGYGARHAWCKGEFYLPGQRRPYRDYNSTAHGDVTLRRALGESCDTFFYELGRDLGIDKMHDDLLRFGLGRMTGVDLDSERSGLVPSREWKRKQKREPWYLGESVIAAIGQGYMLTTPLQLAHSAAVIANRGSGWSPSMVRMTRDPATGEGTPRKGEPWPLIPLRPSAWDQVIEGMTDTVHGERGTARASGAGASYRFAGKTGTAQVYSLGINEDYDADKVAEALRDHGLFIAFAPVEHPEIAIAVVVENGGGGARAAAPVARKVLDAYFLAKAPATTEVAHVRPDR
jgi:penicillin-binding protein 2